MGYREVILQDRPVSYWRLNEDAGTTAFDQMKLFNGTYTNGPSLEARKLPTDAQGGGVKLTGASSQSVIVSSNAAYSASAFSIEGWFWFDSDAGGRQELASKGTGASSYEWELHIRDSSLGNTANFILDSTAAGTYLSATDPTAVVLSQWVHLVGVCDGATGPLHIYRNGVKVADSGASSGTRQGNSTGRVFIGGRDDATNFATATLAEVAYYNSALSPARVLEHYRAGRGLVGRLPRVDLRIP